MLEVIDDGGRVVRLIGGLRFQNGHLHGVIEVHLRQLRWDWGDNRLGMRFDVRRRWGRCYFYGSWSRRTTRCEAADEAEAQKRSRCAGHITNHPGRCAATPPWEGGEWGRVGTNPIRLLSKEGWRDSAGVVSSNFG